MLNVVVGVNDDKLTSDHVICTAPVPRPTASRRSSRCSHLPRPEPEPNPNPNPSPIQVIHEKLGIESGMITTV